ncbi:hypothetical protein [Poriferisphaera sp. WC338]|uniref:hypothetical protein n=1 Tax=Poriferisphaera sp. WC338 TaxID=3425129 RepID=UPI003D818338
MSLCLPTGSEKRAHVLDQCMVLFFVALTMIVLAFFCFIGAGLTYGMSDVGISWVVPTAFLLLAIGLHLVARYIAVTIGGWGMMRRIVKIAQDESDSFLTDCDNKSILMVHVENAQTYDKRKMHLEDACLLSLEPGRIVMEGARYRYVIYAKDVQAISQITHKKTKPACISYQIGEVTLDLSLLERKRKSIIKLILTHRVKQSSEDLVARLKESLHHKPAVMSYT